MMWQAWCLIAWFVVNSFLSVLYIGKTQKITKEVVILNVFFFYPFLIWCVLCVVNR